MQFLFTLLLLSLPFGVICGNLRLETLRRRQKEYPRTYAPRQISWKQEDFYDAKSIVNDWEYFSGPDPTHGEVTYQTKAKAIQKGLATIQDDVAVLSVDGTAMNSQNKRDSVRISSPKTYEGGLFIADFAAMPYGKSLWPAYWSLGGAHTWPADGEIDILEGINDHSNNQYTLHTKPGCQFNPSNDKTFTGTSGSGGDCSGGGCAIADPDPQSFGAGFNAAGGGVYAHLWDHTGIKIWHFSRSDIPADISSKTPDPSKWPTPQAFFAADACNPSEHFVGHRLIINTTLCGDWASSDYGGKSGCQKMVADPSNFQSPSWRVNYFAVYQQQH